jgi:hypothetical protein
MKAMEKLLLVLMVMAVTNPVLAADTLKRPIESRYAESALEGWGRVTGKMRKSFQG